MSATPTIEGFDLGLGYRLNYKNRFELFYARQISRHEIEGEFVAGDNVIWLKYKMFLNPAKPKPLDKYTMNLFDGKTAAAVSQLPTRKKTLPSSKKLTISLYSKKKKTSTTL